MKDGSAQCGAEGQIVDKSQMGPLGHHCRTLSSLFSTVLSDIHTHIHPPRSCRRRRRVPHPCIGHRLMRSFSRVATMSPLATNAAHALHSYAICCSRCSLPFSAPRSDSDDSRVCNHPFTLGATAELSSGTECDRGQSRRV